MKKLSAIFFFTRADKAASIFCKIVLAFSLASCVSATKIQVLDKTGEPDKSVQIYVEGEALGAGEIQYAGKPVPHAAVQLKKAGCQTKREELKLKLNIPGFIGAFTLGMITPFAVSFVAKEFFQVTSLFGQSLWMIGGSGLVLGSVLAFPGITAEYKPVHSYDFQCVKAE